MARNQSMLSREYCIEEEEDDIGISSSAPGMIRWSRQNKFKENFEDREEKLLELDFKSSEYIKIRQSLNGGLLESRDEGINPVPDQQSRKENNSKSKKKSFKSDKTVVQVEEIKLIGSSHQTAFQRKTTLKQDNSLAESRLILDDFQMNLLGDKAHIIKKAKKKKNLMWLSKSSMKGLISYIFDSYLHVNTLLKFCPTIHPEARMKLYWNIFFCICILYQFFTITIELFFDSNWDKISENIQQISNTISAALKYFIIMDVLLNMITGFYYQGDIILDKKKIFKNYLKKLFIVDVLVLVPLFLEFEEEISTHRSALYNSKISLIKLFFIFRLVKLNRTFYYIDQILSINEKIEGVLALVKLFFKILFTAHLVACAWYFVGDYSKRVAYKNWLTNLFEDCDNCDWRSYYLFSLYWSITTMITVGYGDITPSNNLEAGFVIGAEIIGCGLFAYSLSKIGIIFEKIFARENELRSKLRVINRYMKRKEINFVLQGKVRRYLNFIMKEASHESSQNETELINKLSASLRKELLLQANGKILTNSPILKNNFSAKIIEKLSEIMVPVDLAPDEIVYQKGDMASEKLCFVSQGRVDQFVNVFDNKNKLNMTMKSFKAGDVFGAFSFFTGRPREMNAVSVGYTKLYVINKSDFLMLLEDSSDYEVFCHIRDSLLVYLDQSSLFSPCPCCYKIEHDILSCPVLSYVPDKPAVIDRHLERKKCRRVVFQRKPFHTINAFKCTMQLVEAREKLEQNYNLNEFFDEIEKYKASHFLDLQDRLLSEGRVNTNEVVSKEDKKQFFKSDTQKSIKSIMSDGGAENLDSAEKQEKNSKRKQESFVKYKTSLLSSDKTALKHVMPPVSVDMPEKKKPEQRSQPPAIKAQAKEDMVASLAEEKAPVNQSKFLELGKESVVLNIFYMEFDEGKNYVKYFPHNNKALIISSLKKKGMDKSNSPLLRRTNRKGLKKNSRSLLVLSPRRASTRKVNK